MGKRIYRRKRLSPLTCRLCIWKFVCTGDRKCVYTNGTATIAIREKERAHINALPEPFTGNVIDSEAGLRQHIIKHLQVYSERANNEQLFLMADRCQRYVNDLLLRYQTYVATINGYTDSYIAYREMLDITGILEPFEIFDDTAREVLYGRQNTSM